MPADLSGIRAVYGKVQAAIQAEDFDLASVELAVLQDDLQGIFNQAPGENTFADISGADVQLLQEILSFINAQVAALGEQSADIAQQLIKLQTASKMKKAYKS